MASGSPRDSGTTATMGELEPKNRTSVREGKNDTERSLQPTHVSVIVPVYNGMPYVVETIESLLKQTHQNLDILVINDASTDQTLSTIRGYEPQIRILSNSKNLGIYATMNKGIGLVSGDYIAIYHADDVYLPDIVARQARYLDKNPDCGAVFCSDIFVDKDNNEYGRLALPQEVKGNRPLDYAGIINAELTYKNIFLVCPTCMVRKSVYGSVGLYDQERYRNSADLDMYLRIARNYKIAILEDYLLRYRHGHGSSSENYHHLRTEPQRFFMIMDDELEHGARDVATGAAMMHYQAHRHQEYVMCAISAYIKNDLPLARKLLGQSAISVLLSSNKLQRIRMTALLIGLRIVTRLPRSELLSRVFYRRWHQK